MPISALVVTSCSALEVSALRARLAGLAGVEVGEPNGARLPVVVDRADALAHHDLIETIGRLPGVSFVDLVTYDFEDVAHAPRELTQGRRRGVDHGSP